MKKLIIKVILAAFVVLPVLAQNVLYVNKPEGVLSPMMNEPVGASGCGAQKPMR
jgi:hypothetical protein